jgi:hypothetical protein
MPGRTYTQSISLFSAANLFRWKLVRHLLVRARKNPPWLVSRKITQKFPAIKGNTPTEIIAVALTLLKLRGGFVGEF